ncbi:hypothetical protein JCM6882_005373 [Rhodosporidiobolus microsporus]
MSTTDHFAINTACSELLKATAYAPAVRTEVNKLYQDMGTVIRRGKDWDSFGAQVQHELYVATENLAHDLKAGRVEGITHGGRPIPKDLRTYIRPRNLRSLAHSQAHNYWRFGLRHEGIYGISQAQLQRTWA